MKVDIFIHGVPNGHVVWSTTGNDPLIEQFYGAGSNEQTKFLAEVRKSGGQNYCYYSFLKYKNVSAENGRAGSYFGLTIRMDMVCTKVNVLFNILDIIYQTTIVGNFIKEDGDRLRLLVRDFKDKEQVCKGVVEKIMSMLGSSVGGEDFTPITSAMLTGKGAPKLNIAECSATDAITSLVRNGGIAVSPDYPSAQLSAYITKKDAEVNAIRQQSQREISNIQQQSAHDIQEEQQRSNAAVQQTREQAQREIEQTKQRYADVDNKLLAYDRQVKQIQRENRELSSSMSNLQRVIQEKDNIIARLRRGVSTDSRADTASSIHGSDTTQESRKSSPMKAIATVILPFVNLLVTIVLFAVIWWQMPTDNSQAIGQISTDLSEIKEKMAAENKSAIVEETPVSDAMANSGSQSSAVKANTDSEKTSAAGGKSSKGQKQDKAKDMFEKAKAEAAKANANQQKKDESKKEE